MIPFACVFMGVPELLCRIPLSLQFVPCLSRIGLLSTTIPLLINEYQIIVNCAALSIVFFLSPHIATSFSWP